MYVIQYNDIYVESVGTGNVGTELTESEYNAIMQKIQNKPAAPDGYTYKLRADNLEWELVELPEPETQGEELTADEALDIILGGAE